jgi:NADP-dependent 3-hydroxy acid dehydrogenase YdfG
MTILQFASSNRAKHHLKIMDLQLNNKSVLVTGSTAGIGFATAFLFAQEGAAVVVNGRSQLRI